MIYVFIFNQYIQVDLRHCLIWFSDFIFDVFYSLASNVFTWYCKNTNERPLGLIFITIYQAPTLHLGQASDSVIWKGPVKEEYFINAFWMEVFLVQENEHAE